ncbi:MAG: hypothetical protein PHV13_04775 [Candidatus ainarchaeum sp.]|nr:hypothetical protein [Candidatus ainarchaeum sp.]
MDYPEETLATGARGKREARVLKSRGQDFVVYGYVDVETGKTLGKYSILLKGADGKTEHLFIVPAGGKELVVKHETEERPVERAIYDPGAKKAFRF